MTIESRHYEPSDEAFIYDSWLRSYRWSKLAQSVSHERYMASHRALISRLLGSCYVAIAYDSAYPDVAIGWACYDYARAVVHYTYVKQPFRKSGVAKRLLSELDGIACRYSHELRPWEPIRVPSNWVYDPYALMGV